MTGGGEREASAARVRRALAGRGALWTGFVVVHLLLAWLNLSAPGYPMGDVTGVYRVVATVRDLRATRFAKTERLFGVK